jgi:NAD(P)-dependent dehydrogenase (short-subunit alcohol dehydrogenase family)
VFRWVKNNLGGVDVLVNSAGVASANSLVGGFTVPYNDVTAIWLSAYDLRQKHLSPTSSAFQIFGNDYNKSKPHSGGN